MSKQHDIGIVLVTYDLDRTGGGLWVPGKYSHSRIDATAIEYNFLIDLGKKPYVLPTGGSLAWYSPALADIVGASLIEKLGVPYKQVVEENFGSERRALDTAENVLYPLEDLAEKDISHVIFIGNDFQLGRIKACCRLYNKNGSTLEVIAAEDIIESSDPSRRQEMAALRQQARDEGLYDHHNGWRKRILSYRMGANALRLAVHARKWASIFKMPPWEKEADEKRYQ